MILLCTLFTLFGMSLNARLSACIEVLERLLMACGCAATTATCNSKVLNIYQKPSHFVWFKKFILDSASDSFGTHPFVVGIHKFLELLSEFGGVPVHEQRRPIYARRGFLEICQFKINLLWALDKIDLTWLKEHIRKLRGFIRQSRINNIQDSRIENQ